MLEWVLAESIKAITRIKEQASSKSGGAGGRGVASIAYSYYVFTEYFYSYDVMSYFANIPSDSRDCYAN